MVCMDWRESEHPRSPDGRFVDAEGWLVKLSERIDRQRASNPYQALQFYQMDALLERTLHPRPLDATFEVRNGVEVKVGQEVRVARPDPGQEGPPIFQVRTFGTDAFYPPEHTEPIQHVYRAVSVDEWRQALQRGYLQSDQRGTLAPWEGTNAAVDPRDAVSYLPRYGSGVIIKIEIRPENGWFTIAADHYLRTRGSVPLDAVVATTPIIDRDQRGMPYVG